MKRFFYLVFFWLVLTQVLHASPALPIEHWKTPEGTPVAFYPAMEVPMLDINIAFYAGSAYDGQQYGISALTSELLNQGSQGLDANTIADRLARVGAQYDTESSRDSMIIKLRTLSEPNALQEALGILTQILSHPVFPDAAFNREKNKQLLSIRQVEESPEAMANQTFFQALYQNHPYAHPLDGTLKTVEAITVNDVKQFYHQFVVAKNAVIVIVGAIDTPTAKKISNQLMAALPKGNKARDIPDAKLLSEEINIEVPFVTTQTMVRLGQLGIHHNDPDYFPLVVGNHILGGGNLISILATELREKRGLTYGVYSQFSHLTGLGPFMISFSTEQTQARSAENLTRKLLEQFIQTGPSAAELKAAKKYLTGSFPLSIASNQNMAHILLSMLFYGLPDNYLETYVQSIQAVTAQQIQKAFKTHINPARLLSVTVGKT